MFPNKFFYYIYIMSNTNIKLLSKKENNKTTEILRKLSLGIFPMIKNYVYNLNKNVYKIVCPVLFISSLSLGGFYIYKYTPYLLNNNFKILKYIKQNKEEKEEEKEEEEEEIKLF